jgi:hypothetical protein
MPPAPRVSRRSAAASAFGCRSIHVEPQARLSASGEPGSTAPLLLPGRSKAAPLGDPSPSLRPAFEKKRWCWRAMKKDDDSADLGSTPPTQPQESTRHASCSYRDRARISSDHPWCVVVSHPRGEFARTGSRTTGTERTLAAYMRFTSGALAAEPQRQPVGAAERRDPTARRRVTHLPERAGRFSAVQTNAL